LGLPAGQSQQVSCFLPTHPGKSLTRVDGRPSAHLYPDTQMMYCYVCGGPHNPIKLHAIMTDQTYSEAKKELVSEGYDVAEISSRGYKKTMDYKTLSTLRIALMQNLKEGIDKVRAYYKTSESGKVN